MPGAIADRRAAGGLPSLPRRLFAVTPSGLAALRASRAILRRMWRGLDDLLKEAS